MGKSDFTKTSAQVERDIVSLIDQVDRSLDSSNGDTERKGQLLFSAFVSLLVVFGSILLFDYVVKGRDAVPVDASVASPAARLQSERDIRLMEGYLQRVEEQSRHIRDVKTRVAPAMPIDGNLDLIASAVSDMRGLVGIAPKTADSQAASSGASK